MRSACSPESRSPRILTDVQGISFIPNRGFAPWKIIYLLLGALAIGVGVAVLLFMPDSPATALLLTKEERIAAIERIRDEQGGTENKRLKKEQVVEALLDIRSWLIVLATLLSTTLLARVGVDVNPTTRIANIPNGGLANCKSSHKFLDRHTY